MLTYRGSRKDAAALLAAYRFDNEELEVLVTSHDSRKINQEYQEKMVSLVAGRVFRKVFLPAPIAAASGKRLPPAPEQQPSRLTGVSAAP